MPLCWYTMNGNRHWIHLWYQKSCHKIIDNKEIKKLSQKVGIRGRQISEFKTSLVHEVSSRIARAKQRKPSHLPKELGSPELWQTPLIAAPRRPWQADLCEYKLISRTARSDIQINLVLKNQVGGSIWL